jgi:hypothetical protein
MMLAWHITVRTPSPLKAITYVNSDLVLKLQYRMYRIHFPKSYLERFESICVCTVKRLARLALSTPTDRLINQGLYNIEDLQSAVRAEFWHANSPSGG